MVSNAARRSNKTSTETRTGNYVMLKVTLLIGYCFLKNLTEEGKVSYGSTVGLNIWIKCQLFKQRFNQGYFKRPWHTSREKGQVDHVEYRSTE